MHACSMMLGLGEDVNKSFVCRKDALSKMQSKLGLCCIKSECTIPHGFVFLQRGVPTEQPILEKFAHANILAN